jgi:iron complex outermembrane recepter protein
LNSPIKLKKLARAIQRSLIVGSAATLVISPNLYAEEETEEENRITITGSAIKRTDVEDSLPVTQITQEDIISLGVTSVPELIEQMPAMQGFTTAADSVGGGGGGVQTASLRDLGGQYTLVLLNGRRMASSGSGSSIDINSIPLSAIERVDVLTDGASALYGSDAIAGVVNFILKKDVDETTIRARFDKPQEKGGEKINFSLTTGLVGDGYSILLAYNHDEQEVLKSKDRDFAKTGLIHFEYQGENLVWQRTSANAIPANAYLDFNDVVPDRNFNPYREANGQCAPNNAPDGSTCIYDFTETLEIFPESVRDNLYLSANFDFNSDLRGFTTLAFGKFEQTVRIAPYPTGTFTLPLDSQIVADNIIPYLTPEEEANLTRVAVRWRARPGGNRTTEWATETLNFNAGIEGESGDIAYEVVGTYATSDRDQNRITGFPIQEPFLNLLSSGAVNIFDTPENLSDEANQAVADTMFSGNWTNTETSMKAIEGKFSMPMFQMSGGDAYFASGFDYRKVAYTATSSQANLDEIVLFESATPEFDLSRDTYGVFAEAVFPISDDLEVTTSLRYDNIGKITDTSRAAGMQAVNDDVNDTTYKVHMAYRPNDDWLIRASVGTGFKSPTMRQIAEPRIEFGVTSSAYECPFSAGDPLADLCDANSIQYDVYREGYSELQPEKSEQASVGFVYAPSREFSFNIDWWQVNLTDQVARVTQDQIFGDPVTYRDLFTSRIDPGTGDEVLAIIQAPVNIGESNNEGFDWGLQLTNEFSFGKLRTSVNGTYITESESLVVGTEDEFQTSLGEFGPNQAVTFRNIIQINNTLSMDHFDHRLNINYRSGYRDQYFAGGANRIRLASDLSQNYDGGVQLYVPSYMTMNYSTTYRVNEDTNVTFGINNLMDKQPPFTLRTGGAGHQVGYDPRYSDPFGRTFYISADYTF